MPMPAVVGWASSRLQNRSQLLSVTPELEPVAAGRRDQGSGSGFYRLVSDSLVSCFAVGGLLGKAQGALLRQFVQFLLSGEQIM